MARKYDYFSSAKSLTDNSTTTWSAGEIPSANVVAYHLAWQDSTTDGAVPSDITRVRVKANGVLLVDMSGTMLRAYNQRFGGSHPPYGDKQLAASSAAATTDSNQRITIPLYDMTQYDEDRADMTQFPPGAGVTIEVTVGTVGTCTAQIGWTETDQPARAYPKLISQAMNIGTSATNARFSFSDEGFIRAIGINSAGNLRTRLVLSGEQVLHLGGQMNTSATRFTSLLNECQQLDNRMNDLTVATATASALTGSTLLDPVWLKVAARPAAQGRTFVELTTGASIWAGTANELAYFAQVPLGGGS